MLQVRILSGVPKYFISMCMIDLEKIHVIDDIVPKSYQEAIKEKLLGPYMDWNYIDNIALRNTKVFSPAVSHNYYSRGEFQTKHYDLIRPLAYFAAEHIGYNIREILKARSFMHFPLSEKIRHEHDGIHVDLQQEHLVILYYVFDSEGDTLMYHSIKNPYSSVSAYAELPEEPLYRVSPKQGRFVVFNGRRFHCSTPPTDCMRCVINFNVL